MTDREKLANILKSQSYGYHTYDEMADYLLANGIMELVRNHGEWIPVELNRSFGSFTGIKCSLCDFEKIKSPLVKAPNYCENCGAKMKAIFKKNN